MRRIRPALVPILLAAGGLLAVVLPSWAGFGTVADLFREGRYQEARQTLQAGGEGARPGEDILWNSRLAGSVDEALAELERARGGRDLPPAVRQRIALEMAEIHFARGDFRNCLADLEPVLDQGQESVPGEAYLLAGLTYRLVGQLQSAREMFASVRPADPAFAQARYHLGDIGLQQGDATLALRYFESGQRSDSGLSHPALLEGQWRALRAGGDEQAALSALDRLRRQAPGSLALLEVGRLQREEAEELAARGEAGAASADSTATRAADPSGRYSLQLGAFSDRSLALDFQRRFAARLPDLRIDQEQDGRGQFLYKVRSGYFVNPALARTEAARLKRALGVEVLVTDLAGTPRFGD